MVGLGEEREEIIAVLEDLRRVGVSILTIGQYLRPTPQHAPMTRYYHPDEFAALKKIGMEFGFVHVEAGPLVRSSYHAHEQQEAYTTILKLLQIMADKGLVQRDQSARTHVYTAALTEDQTQKQLVTDLLARAFDGSAAKLVLHALSSGTASAEELAEIRALID